MSDDLQKEIAEKEEELRRLQDINAKAAEQAENNRQRTLARLDEKYFLLNCGGQVRVGELVREGEQRVLRLYTVSDFLLWEVELVPSTRGKKQVKEKAASIWLSRVQSPRYQGIGLYEKTPENYLNLWEGLAVAPHEVKWAHIHRFLLNVVCGGNDEYLGYLLNLFAYWVQHPTKVGLCGLMLTGEKGQGKGTVFQIAKRIFGSGHSLQVTNPNQVAGRFNGHLVDTLLLFADEALFRGDKRLLGTLNQMITEDALFIEKKNVNGFQVPNRLKIIVGSNDPLPVHVTKDERRYLSLEVKYAEAEEKASYFERLYAALDDEVPGLLNHLLNLEVDEATVRNPPVTETLENQQSESENPWTPIFREHLELERSKPEFIQRRIGRPTDTPITLTTDLAWDMVRVEPDRRTNVLKGQLFEALREAGWVYGKVRDGDDRPYGWRARC